MATKVHLKGYLKDLTNNTRTSFETKAIKNKNKISYPFNDEIYILKTVAPNHLILNRKTKEIDCTFSFQLGQNLPTIYTMIENDLSLEIEIRTDYLKITENNIKVKYTVIDSDISYEYNIEMSE